MVARAAEGLTRAMTVNPSDIGIGRPWGSLKSDGLTHDAYKPVRNETPEQRQERISREQRREDITAAVKTLQKCLETIRQRHVDDPAWSFHRLNCASSGISIIHCCQNSLASIKAHAAAHCFAAAATCYTETSLRQMLVSIIGFWPQCKHNRQQLEEPQVHHDFCEAILDLDGFLNQSA